MHSRKQVDLFSKRAFDVAVATLVMLVMAPVIIAVGIVVTAKLGRPLLFKEQRPGLGGRPFTIRKFRTMTLERSADGAPLPDVHRLTAFGRTLRATSLDELPELWNVLTGDMSLVGPRPLLMEYLPLYTPEQARRHDVRPGITGLAQVRGRNRLSWDEKFKLDIWYVDNRTFWLDMHILWATLVTVLKREDISHPGESTMPKYKGSVK